MTGPRLFVCGPANGSVSFELPTGRHGNDDSVFLPSSIFTPHTGEWVLRVWTLRSGGEKLVRVGLYRQVFEPGLDRPGHAFSSVLEFEGDLPPGELVVQTLWEICDLIEAQCINSGHFCSLEQFQNLFTSELLPSFSGITAQVFANGAADAIWDRAADNSYSRIYHPLPNWSISSLGRVVEWFFRAPASFLCESLIVARPSTGIPGHEFREVVLLEALLPVALDALTRQVAQERSLSAQNSQQYEWEKEKATRELGNARNELINTTQKLEQTRRYAQDLERKLIQLEQELDFSKRSPLAITGDMYPRVDRTAPTFSKKNGPAGLGTVRLDVNRDKASTNRTQNNTSKDIYALKLKWIFYIICGVLIVATVSLITFIVLNYISR